MARLPTRVRRVMARGFTSGAGAYARSRPDYPLELARFAQRTFHLGPGSTIVDLAAGTGKLTQTWRPVRARIIAIEPLPAMRKEFRRALPGVELRAGTAERTGLPDACADLVSVGQAFHWFDAEKAFREIHRILRPGGALVIAYNWRDTSTGWRRPVARIAHEYDERKVPHHRQWVGWKKALRGQPGFSRARVQLFHHPPQRLTLRGVEDRMLSVSYLGALSPERKEEFLGRLRHVLATHPSTRGRRTFQIPYTTEVHWCVKRADRRAVSVRDYRPSDRHDLDRWHAGLYSDIHRTDRRYYAPLSLAQSHADMTENLAISARTVSVQLVAELGGRPCGHLLAELTEMPSRHHQLTRRPNRDGLIATLFVERWARRQGVATALLNEAERRLRALGCDNLQLGVVASNTVARRLYRKLRYREFGLRLRKDIAPPPRSWQQVAAWRRSTRARPRAIARRHPSGRSKGR